MATVHVSIATVCWWPVLLLFILLVASASDRVSVNCSQSSNSVGLQQESVDYVLFINVYVDIYVKDSDVEKISLICKDDRMLQE